jgi:50S ribosomal subunit-associated GTPase HflX
LDELERLATTDASGVADRMVQVRGRADLVTYAGSRKVREVVELADAVTDNVPQGAHPHLGQLAVETTPSAS